MPSDDTCILSRICIVNLHNIAFQEVVGILISFSLSGQANYDIPVGFSIPPYKKDVGERLHQLLHICI